MQPQDGVGPPYCSFCVKQITKFAFKCTECSSLFCVKCLQCSSEDTKHKIGHNCEVSATDRDTLLARSCSSHRVKLDKWEEASAIFRNKCDEHRSCDESIMNRAAMKQKECIENLFKDDMGTAFDNSSGNRLLYHRIAVAAAVSEKGLAAAAALLYSTAACCNLLYALAIHATVAARAAEMLQELMDDYGEERRDSSDLRSCGAQAMEIPICVAPQMELTVGGGVGARQQPLISLFIPTTLLSTPRPFTTAPARVHSATIGGSAGSGRFPPTTSSSPANQPCGTGAVSRAGSAAGTRPSQSGQSTSRYSRMATRLRALFGGRKSTERRMRTLEEAGDTPAEEDIPADQRDVTRLTPPHSIDDWNCCARAPIDDWTCCAPIERLPMPYDARLTPARHCSPLPSGFVPSPVAYAIDDDDRLEPQRIWQYEDVAHPYREPFPPEPLVPLPTDVSDAPCYDLSEYEGEMVPGWEHAFRAPRVCMPLSHAVSYYALIRHFEVFSHAATRTFARCIRERRFDLLAQMDPFLPAFPQRARHWISPPHVALYLIGEPLAPKYSTIFTMRAATHRKLYSVEGFLVQESMLTEHAQIWQTEVERLASAAIWWRHAQPTAAQRDAFMHHCAMIRAQDLAAPQWKGDDLNKEHGHYLPLPFRYVRFAPENDQYRACDPYAGVELPHDLTVARVDTVQFEIIKPQTLPKEDVSKKSKFNFMKNIRKKKVKEEDKEEIADPMERRLVLWERGPQEEEQERSARAQWMASFHEWPNERLPRSTPLNAALAAQGEVARKNRDGRLGQQPVQEFLPEVILVVENYYASTLSDHDDREDDALVEEMTAMTVVQSPRVQPPCAQRAIRLEHAEHLSKPPEKKDESKDPLRKIVRKPPKEERMPRIAEERVAELLGAAAARVAPKPAQPDDDHMEEEEEASKESEELLTESESERDSDEESSMEIADGLALRRALEDKTWETFSNQPGDDLIRFEAEKDAHEEALRQARQAAEKALPGLKARLAPYSWQAISARVKEKIALYCRDHARIGFKKADRRAYVEAHLSVMAEQWPNPDQYSGVIRAVVDAAYNPETDANLPAMTPFLPELRYLEDVVKKGTGVSVQALARRAMYMGVYDEKDTRRYVFDMLLAYFKQELGEGARPLVVDEWARPLTPSALLPHALERPLTLATVPPAFHYRTPTHDFTRVLAHRTFIGASLMSWYACYDTPDDADVREQAAKVWTAFLMASGRSTARFMPVLSQRQLFVIFLLFTKIDREWKVHAEVRPHENTIRYVAELLVHPLVTDMPKNALPRALDALRRINRCARVRALAVFKMEGDDFLSTLISFYREFAPVDERVMARTGRPLTAADLLCAGHESLQGMRRTAARREQARSGRRHTKARRDSERAVLAQLVEDRIGDDYEWNLDEIAAKLLETLGAIGSEYVPTPADFDERVHHIVQLSPEFAQRWAKERSAHWWMQEGEYVRDFEEMNRPRDFGPSAAERRNRRRSTSPNEGRRLCSTADSRADWRASLMLPDIPLRKRDRHPLWELRAAQAARLFGYRPIPVVDIWDPKLHKTDDDGYQSGLRVEEWMISENAESYGQLSRRLAQECEEWYSQRMAAIVTGITKLHPDGLRKFRLNPTPGWKELSRRARKANAIVSSPQFTIANFREDGTAMPWWAPRRVSRRVAADANRLSRSARRSLLNPPADPNPPTSMQWHIAARQAEAADLFAEPEAARSRLAAIVTSSGSTKVLKKRKK